VGTKLLKMKPKFHFVLIKLLERICLLFDFWLAENDLEICAVTMATISTGNV